MANPKDYPVCPPHLRRFRARFYSGYYEDEGCHKPDFPIWMSGQTCQRRDPEYEWAPNSWDAVRSIELSGDDDAYDHACELYSRDDGIWIAFLDVRDRKHAIRRIETFFPDYFDLDLDEVPRDWVPGDRFL